MITNSLLNYLDRLELLTERWVSTTLMRATTSLRGINLGSNVSFFGLAVFKRATHGSISVGKNCIFRSSRHSNLIGIDRPCIITATGNGSKLTIGDYCGFSGTVIGCFLSITIGTNVRCGANTLITDSDWHLDDPRVGSPSPIILEDNVWLGVNVTVLKGVTIGKNSIIGANSVVVRDIPPNVVAAGNPCVVLKPLNNVNA